MNEQTDLTLPRTLPYPVTVSKRLVSPGDEIKRGTPLLYYSFRHKSRDDPEVETRYGTWESYVEGTVNFWNVETGDVVNRDYGPVLVVTEPCKHGVQIAGMCANCGKDMTDIDYMSVSSSERAKIKMDYMADGPLMSFEEAARIERESSQVLLKKRKLSLIVDLDQTIIHTTCDPTVGEWMSAKEAPRDGSTTPPSESVNWPALDDVVHFQLADEHHYGRMKTDPTWYYVKPRPGLSEFMNKISKLYEMHVYTMGTRSYADAVCAAIDPSGEWFGQRILTRSESGSDRFKSLKRLFPSDQSMVVIIDDRADVWEWSPNLVRVNAYEFFVGTGDINAAFLPKQTDVLSGSASTDPSGSESQPNKSAPLEDLPAMQIKDSEEANSKIRQAEEVERELEERPLAKAQESLDSKTEAPKDPSVAGSGDKQNTPPIPDALEHRIKKAILNNDDKELVRVEDILCEVHRKFYEMNDARSQERNRSIPDVARLITQRKAKTLSGLGLVFSGLYPIQPHPERTDIWKSAVSFGATCHADINSKVTHLVAAKPGTAKTEKAFSLGNIFVVNDRWLRDSQAQWQRQPEDPYLLKPGHRKAPSITFAPDKQANGASAHTEPVDQSGPETKSSEPLATKSEDQSDTLAKVSAVEDYTRNGTNSRASVSENGGEQPVETTEPEQEKDGDIELDIDWAEIDKEVEDALASDDDDDNTDVNSEDAMSGVVQTVRGTKRQRVDETSAPSTPSRLRFSTVATYARESEGPSPKRQKVETNISTPNPSIQESLKLRSPLNPDAAKDDTKPSPSRSVEGDDDSKASEPPVEQAENQTDGGDEDEDDFLAREMAEDADTDDWDSSDEED